MLVHLNSIIKKILIVILMTVISFSAAAEEKKIDLIEINWTFDGIFGTFDRASL